MTAAEAIRAAIPRLIAAGVDGAARDARLLMAHALTLAPDRVTLHQGPIGPTAAARFEAAIAARVTRQPVSQIIGTRLFWGLNFRVTPDVLDPRPETELLVATALERPFHNLLDLGTGSGCVLLSALHAMPAARGLGVDLSPAALQVASDNARSLGLTDRARFAQSDWCGAVSGQFDLILSNPPYIAAAEMADLAAEVRDHEPHIALTPGGDGLAAYRAIAAQAPAHLLPHGRLIVEIGPTQGRAVADLFAAQGLADIRILPDLDGRDRVVAATKPDQP